MIYVRLCGRMYVSILIFMLRRAANLPTGHPLSSQRSVHILFGEQHRIVLPWWLCTKNHPASGDNSKDTEDGYISCSVPQVLESMLFERE